MAATSGARRLVTLLVSGIVLAGPIAPAWGQISLNRPSGASRAGTSVLTTPVVAAVSPVRLVAGGLVTINGSNLEGATEARLAVGCVITGTGQVSCGTPSANLKAPLSQVSDGSAQFVMPPAPGIGDGAPIVLTVANARYVGTYTTVLSLDAKPMFSGSPITVVAGTAFLTGGQNLHRATKAYLGVGTPNSAGNPAFQATPSPNGLAVQVNTSAGCNGTVNLVLEETPGPANWPSTATNPSPSFVTGSRQVTCTGGIATTSIAPAAGPVGTSIVVQGFGFNSISGVTYLGNPVTWSRQSDNQLTFSLPPQPNGLGALTTQVVLVRPTMPIEVSPRPVTLFPPRVDDIQPQTVFYDQPVAVFEPGQALNITGYGLKQDPYLTPTVYVGKAVAPIESAYVTQIVITVPPGAESGPLTVTTAGGTTQTKPILVLSGPTVVKDVTPSAAGPGEQITILGTNLYRLYGLCVGGQIAMPFLKGSESWRQWTNESVKFEIPKTWTGSVEIVPAVAVSGQIMCLPSKVYVEVK